MLMPAVLPSRSVVAARAQEPPPAAPESQDAALLAELAQRWRVGPTGAVRAANVLQLLPGQLPDAMPLTVPIPAGSRLVGSVLRGAGGQTTSVGVVLDAPGSVVDLRADYQQALARQGWYPPPRGVERAMPGGGMAVRVPPGLEGGWQGWYCDARSRLALSLGIDARPSGLSDVRVGVSDSPRGACELPPTWPTGSQRGGSFLPALQQPPGEQLRPRSAGFSGTGDADDFDLLSDRSAMELEAHFARQLAAVGWQRQAGEAAGSFAWSLWNAGHVSTPEGGEGDWQGLLYVLAVPGTNRRALRLQVDYGRAARPATLPAASGPTSEVAAEAVARLGQSALQAPGPQVLFSGSGGPATVSTPYGPQPVARTPLDAVPRLVAPEGVEFAQAGATGGWVATTARGATELEAHFAAQMAAAGWRRQAGEGVGLLAWSLWLPPTGEDPVVLLLVRDGPGAGQRTLYVRAESAASPIGPPLGAPPPQPGGFVPSSPAGPPPTPRPLPPRLPETCAAATPVPTAPGPARALLYGARAVEATDAGALLALALPTGQVLGCRDVAAPTTASNFAVAPDGRRIYLYERDAAGWHLVELEAPTLRRLRRTDVPDTLADWALVGETFAVAQDGREVYLEMVRSAGPPRRDERGSFTPAEGEYGIVVYDVAQGAFARTLPLDAPPCGLGQLYPLPDGRLAIVCPTAREVRLLDPGDGTLLSRVDLRDAVPSSEGRSPLGAAAPSPDGRFLWLVVNGGTVLQLDLAAGTVVRRDELGGSGARPPGQWGRDPTSRFSADAQRVFLRVPPGNVAAITGDTLGIFATATGERIGQIMLRGAPVLEVAPVSDGEALVATFESGTQLVELPSGRDLGTWWGNLARIQLAAAP